MVPKGGDDCVVPANLFYAKSFLATIPPLFASLLSRAHNSR
jgi:hypothetical protein